MQRDLYPIIAREGWERLAVAFVVCLFASFTIGGWSILFWIGFAFMLQFFRDPPRNIQAAANEVVAPASGKIVCVEQADDPYLDRACIKISVFMNVFSVHSNLIPITGKIVERWYSPGKICQRCIGQGLDRQRTQCTERCKPMMVRMWCLCKIAGLIARRILCYVEPGDEVDTGDRYGFIRFGSRVDLYLPKNAEIKVQLGQWVNSGNDVVASL